VLAPIRFIVGGLLENLPDLFFLAVLILIARYLLRLARLFFASVGSGEVEIGQFDPAWADPTYKLVRLAIVALTLVVAYPYIPGSNSAAFQGVSIFAGIVFSLGSSSVIANFVAGYTIVYRRAFHEGDLVQIGEAFGVVTRMRLQAVHLQSPKNEEVVIPSAGILGSVVVNYSALAQSEGLILHTTVGIGYETPWRQVEAMLLEAARRTDGLLAEPPPFVLQLALGDFAVTYEINAFSREPKRLKRIYSALHRNILDVFNEYGVQIMTPAYEGDPEQPKLVPKERWHVAPAAAQAPGE
jgi:small-conductance mechanosensitive channel